ncbi:uncharacterized protein LOC130996958 isoform X1 [Salvia miltiorrhiza]|uniref:uncharacterized protein LOC130996958 isoform X1 n=1 Tax=Salvia miltiorrhiza TaxID=226208 RepID=UPI0025AB7B16|nr:uncharacterized protein LOC130996958 isoform X1 [Salvia miltiorrhiza]
MTSNSSQVASSTDGDDPAKRYGTPNPLNKSNWTCNFCSKSTNGGAYRMKQHLVGGFRSVKKCPKAPEHVREEVRTYMINKATCKVTNSFQRWEPQGEEEEEEMEVLGSSSHTVTSKVAPAPKRMKGPLDVLLAPKKPNPQSQEILKGRKERKGIFGACDKVCREKACEAIARKWMRWTPKCWSSRKNGQ